MHAFWANPNPLLQEVKILKEDGDSEYRVCCAIATKCILSGRCLQWLRALCRWRESPRSIEEIRRFTKEGFYVETAHAPWRRPQGADLWNDSSHSVKVEFHATSGNQEEATRSGTASFILCSRESIHVNFKGGHDVKENMFSVYQVNDDEKRVHTYFVDYPLPHGARCTFINTKLVHDASTETDRSLNESAHFTSGFADASKIGSDKAPDKEHKREAGGLERHH